MNEKNASSLHTNIISLECLFPPLLDCLPGLSSIPTRIFFCLKNKVIKHTSLLSCSGSFVQTKYIHLEMLLPFHTWKKEEPYIHNEYCRKGSLQLSPSSSAIYHQSWTLSFTRLTSEDILRESSGYYDLGSI